MTDADVLRVGLQVAATVGLGCALTRLRRIAAGRARTLRATSAHAPALMTRRAAVTPLLPPVLAAVTLPVPASTWPGMVTAAAVSTLRGTVGGVLLWWLALPAVALVTLTWVGAADPGDLRAAARACSALLDQRPSPEDGGRGRRG